MIQMKRLNMNKFFTHQVAISATEESVMLIDATHEITYLVALSFDQRVGVDLCMLHIHEDGWHVGNQFPYVERVQ